MKSFHFAQYIIPEYAKNQNTVVEFVNSVDPNEEAHNKQLNLHYLPSSLSLI